MNDAEVILAVKPLGFVGDVRVVTLIGSELVFPVPLTAVTTSLYKVFGSLPVKVAKPLFIEGVMAEPSMVYV